MCRQGDGGTDGNEPDDDQWRHRTAGPVLQDQDHPTGQERERADDHERGDRAAGDREVTGLGKHGGRRRRGRGGYTS